MPKKKAKEFCCSCGADFDSDTQLISHCRKQHPENPEILYEAINTLGDKFADIYIEQLRTAKQKLTILVDNVRFELEKCKEENVRLVDAHNDLVYKYNQLASLFTSIASIVDVAEVISKDPKRSKNNESDV